MKRASPTNSEPADALRTRANPTALRLQNISAAYGAQTVLADITLEARAGELVALLGSSGCGKTTLLKIVAGLLQPTGGEVFFGEERFTDVAAERRGVGVVFQKPLLFPYLSVGENVAFGLKMRRTPRHETKRRVAEALCSVQLEGYESRRSGELSGGQEQRVALARALVTEPRVLLLDEPFSALDASLRAEMRALVHSLQRRSKITTLFVTHDQQEAATLADRIAFLHDGSLMQFGAPRDFHLAPATAEVARFFGWLVIEGTRHLNTIETALGRFNIAPREQAKDEPTLHDTDRSVLLAIHPARVRLVPSHASAERDSPNHFAATLESHVDLGRHIRYTFRLPSNRSLTVEEDAFDCRHRRPAHEREEFLLHISPDALIVFD